MVCFNRLKVFLLVAMVCAAQCHQLVKNGAAKYVKWLQTLRSKGSALALSAVLCNPLTAFADQSVPSMGECVTQSSPQATTVMCRQLGLVDGRLRGCNANVNCFSSSAVAARKYESPWIYTQDTDAAWQILRTAVESEGLKVLKADSEKHYLLAAEKDVPKQPAGASLFYEFLLRPEDKIVLHRAVVDKTVFIYPLQQPVSDFGALQARMKAIFFKTAWKSYGEQDALEAYYR